MLNAESEAAQDFTATPEARLWLNVMFRAAVQLKDSTEWLAKAFKRGAPQLRDYEPEDQRGHASPLHKQVQKHVRRVRSAEQFFFGQDSTFGGICEMLGYDETEFRSRVTACLGEREGVLQKAEAFVDAMGFGDCREAARREKVNPQSSTVIPRILVISRAGPESRESS